MKQLVFVKDYRVEIKEFNDVDFNDSEATIGKREYTRQLQDFESMLDELRKMDDPEYRQAHASEFLRINSVWLYNLAKTGFAVEYSQFIKE